MKAINIFKAAAYVLVLPALLLTSACSSDDVQNIEQTPEPFRGYVRHVTVKATCDAGDATRAYYDEGQLFFSPGDKIFFGGTNSVSGRYAMLLDYTCPSTFGGDLYTEKEYTGTLSDLISSNCSARNYAQLLPAGYEAFGYYIINNENTYNMNVAFDMSRAFAPTKKIAIEQFFSECATTFTNKNGFIFQASNGVISFTLNGLEPLTTYKLTFRSKTGNNVFDISGTSTSDNTGTVTFAVGTTTSNISTQYYVIIDDGGKYMDIDLGNKAIQANYVVNVKPISVTAKEVVDLAGLSAGTYTANHGVILTGTLPAGVDIQIADGASVVLRDAVIKTTITSVGDATVILEGESTVTGTGAGIQAGPSGKSLTIKGNGQLTVQGADNCAAIGTGNGGTCGDINIEGGTVIATAGTDAAAIGAGVGGTCGKIYINGGSIEATSKGRGAGIGTGDNGTCGQIVITKNVISVFARKGVYAMHSIGKGTDDSTIGSVLIGGFSGAISDSPYVYPETYVETWNFIDVTSFNLAANKDTKGGTIGCTLRSKGGTVVQGHMSGMFNFIAPYNRQFTKITIKGICTSVSGDGWTETESGVEWSGTPAQYVHIECDIKDVEQIVFTYQ